MKSSASKQKRITLAQARKVRSVVQAGLTNGLGQPEPGKMCVEAAVCYALGLPHGDEPPCVHPYVRRFKIRLNDAAWPSDAARAEGMLDLAVAQLGTNDPKFDGQKFVNVVARETIRQIVPHALSLLLKVERIKEWHPAIVVAIQACETAPNRDAAIAARDLARKIREQDWSAASAAAFASADFAFDDDAAAAARDSVLSVCAKIGIQALRAAGAHGITLLDKINKE